MIGNAGKIVVKIFKCNTKKYTRKHALAIYKTTKYQ